MRNNCYLTSFLEAGDREGAGFFFLTAFLLPSAVAKPGSNCPPCLRITKPHICFCDAPLTPMILASRPRSRTGWPANLPLRSVPLTPDGAGPVHEATGGHGFASPPLPTPGDIIHSSSQASHPSSSPRAQTPHFCSRQAPFSAIRAQNLHFVHTRSISSPSVNKFPSFVHAEPLSLPSVNKYPVFVHAEPLSLPSVHNNGFFVPAERISVVIYKCLRNSNISKVSLAKSVREVLAYFLIISHLQITGG